jgi:hypothetical protein
MLLLLHVPAQRNSLGRDWCFFFVSDVPSWLIYTRFNSKNTSKLFGLVWHGLFFIALCVFVPASLCCSSTFFFLLTIQHRTQSNGLLLWRFNIVWLTKLSIPNNNNVDRMMNSSALARFLGIYVSCVQLPCYPVIARVPLSSYLYYLCFEM